MCAGGTSGGGLGDAAPCLPVGGMLGVKRGQPVQVVEADVEGVTEAGGVSICKWVRSSTI